MNQSAAIPVNTPANGRSWIANLNLNFSRTQTGSRLSSVERNGPLSVQKAFYPEGPDCAHVYLLHPPAGIVSGDELHLSATLEANSHALLTTPGANRFYRARDDKNLGTTLQLQQTHYQIADHATLEHLPQETLIFQGADAVNKIKIELTPSSVYLGWDVICLGLPVMNQAFDKGQFEQLSEVKVGNKLVFHDRLKVNQDNQLLNKAAGLGGHHVVGTFIAAAPVQLSGEQNRHKCEALTEQLRAKITELNASDKVSISQLDMLFVIRYLGDKSEECKKYFAALWQILRQALCQREANIPRIWLT
ncbi:urease accessory protein UreD [Catenovulum sp. 2E275]|uniref:urease accessory protein UreD n=1 Tax=Catenovulum sp. 2E275 TaxID=2980497 RepID=UPI0021D0D28E|nr:urease accessory protein UreD [Catenovulum sp. 2E275]MCU4676940.1 urease accessory protein UreD [Catenovulum sp. 2E275]